MAEAQSSRSGFVSALVLLVASVASGYRCPRQCMAQDESLCLFTDSCAPSGAAQGTNGQSETSVVSGLWPTQICFSDMVSVLVYPPGVVPLRLDLLTQAQVMFWHPCPDIRKLWVWPGSRMR